jgi:hypothetical protein
MTPEEIDASLSNLMRANAPEILVRAAKVLFEAGWHDRDVGELIVILGRAAVVCDTQEEAVAVAARDAPAGKLN